MMEHVESADGTLIALERTGHGPSLVLVVGAFSDRTSTNALAAGLSSQYEVWAYDRRGRGDSSDTVPWAIEREVEDLGAVIDASGGDAFVFGHSSGGALALEGAAAGLPVRAVAVYEPPYTSGPSDAFADHLDALIAAGQPGEAVEKFLILMGTPPQALNQMKAGPYWAHMLSFAPTLSHEVRLCNNGRVPSQQLAAITAPTLALAGSITPWGGEVIAAIAAAIPGGRSLVLEGQGHGVADDVLIPVLESFFTSSSDR